MPVEQIQAFLVHPGSGGGVRVDVNGTPVPLEGPMHALLDGIYQRSVYECDIDITFRHTEGRQQNACRDIVIAYLRGPTIDTARVIAERLRENTDRRSGLGLLFVIAGRETANHKIVISRFPTDSAIYVDEGVRALTVEFLERVFMKNKASYKAVVYEDRSLQAGFWSGRAVDKQLNNAAGQPSDYWISDFLLSEFSATPAHGTRRLAEALKDAVRKSPLEVKQELTAAATLAGNLAGQPVSITTFGDHFHLSQRAREALIREAKTPRAAEEQFEFDLREFRNRIAYKSLELDNGAVLTAESSIFDNVFQRRVVDGVADQLVEFSTRGRVLNEKLKIAQ